MGFSNPSIYYRECPSHERVQQLPFCSCRNGHLSNRDVRRFGLTWRHHNNHSLPFFLFCRCSQLHICKVKNTGVLHEQSEIREWFTDVPMNVSPFAFPSPGEWTPFKETNRWRRSFSCRKLAISLCKHKIGHDMDEEGMSKEAKNKLFWSLLPSFCPSSPSWTQVGVQRLEPRGEYLSASSPSPSVVSGAHQQTAPFPLRICTGKQDV